MRRLGYGRFRVAVANEPVGDRAQLFGHDASGREHLLIELVVEKREVGGEKLLYVHWLTLRHPLARFSELRPPLPDQEVPGLGLAREMGLLLARMAERQGLAGVAFRPAAFHTAYAGRAQLRFVDQRRQGRFEALVRDLEDRFGELPLPVRNLLEYARLRILGRARGVTSIERTGQGIEIKFHETARVDPERIVELVASGNGVTFAPPATLRLQAGAARAELFSSIETVLREIA